MGKRRSSLLTLHLAASLKLVLFLPLPVPFCLLSRKWVSKHGKCTGKGRRRKCIRWEHNKTLRKGKREGSASCCCLRMKTAKHEKSVYTADWHWPSNLSQSQAASKAPIPCDLKQAIVRPLSALSISQCHRRASFVTFLLSPP